jgi:hypothetical protein
MRVNGLLPGSNVLGAGHSSISILEIIFVHYVAKSFCETVQLPKELPKIAKCLKLRYSVDINKKNTISGIILFSWVLDSHTLSIDRSY